MTDLTLSTVAENLQLTSTQRVLRSARCRALFAGAERMAAFAAMLLTAAMAIAPAIEAASEGQAAAVQPQAGDVLTGKGGGSSRFGGNETVVAAYAGAPLYYRSDVHLQRPNGTDMTLKRLGWDGDALYFPIDGGARVIRWSGSLGTMIDFTHNKAVARLGKGAHGRKISNGVIEDVETQGTLKGQPAPSPMKLTDLVDRLEFSHGHNVLLLTGLARLAPLSSKVRPYLGIGFGVSVPHVEVGFTGEERAKRTNQYQYAGPALQILAGFELRSGRGSYFIEYKFIVSFIDAALTGGKSWSLQDLDIPWLPDWFIEPFVGLTEMPGDLWHQFSRWRTGEAPSEGTLSTHLSAHEVVFGAGYVWPRDVPASPARAGP